MLVSDVIIKAFSAAQGKATPPNSSNPKYQQLVVIVDSMQKMWADEPDIDWYSHYLRVSISIGASATSYPLPTTVHYVLKNQDDPVLIGTTEYQVVRADQLYRYQTSNVCAQVGSTLVFPTALDPSLIGSTISVPTITKVANITDPSQTVEVDSPMWLVYAVAAEYDRNDIVKSSNYQNLIALSGQFMDKMRERNAASQESADLDFYVLGETW